MANGGKSTHKLKILYAEDDAEVIVGQAVSIQKAGHHVTQALGRSGALDALERDAFDLVVLGPTLPYMVKKTHPGTRVLVMHTDGERHPQVDGNLETGKSIDDLVAKIAVMLEQDAVSQ